MPEMQGVSDETPERVRDRRLSRRIDQQLRHLIREIVAGSAVHRPIFPQRLSAGEDFLDDHVDGAAILRQRHSQRLCATPLQFFEIFSRQIKTVRVIDAQSGDGPGRNQLEKKLMSGVKNLGQFHTDGREIVHVEKTPVVNFLCRHAPEG